MNPSLIKELEDAVDRLSNSSAALCRQDQEQILYLQKIALRILDGLKADDIEKVKLECFNFSHLISDSYFTNPGIIREINNAVGRVRSGTK